MKETCDCDVTTLEVSAVWNHESGYVWCPKHRVHVAVELVWHPNPQHQRIPDDDGAA